MEHFQANVGVRLTIELPAEGVSMLNSAASDAGGDAAGGDVSGDV